MKRRPIAREAEGEEGRGWKTAEEGKKGGKWEMRRREEERDEYWKEKEERTETRRNGKRGKKKTKDVIGFFFIIPRPINIGIHFSFLMATVLLYPSLDL